MQEDERNDVQDDDAEVDPGNVRRPRLDPPRKLLLAAVGVLVAGDEVPALDGHGLAVVDEILDAVGPAASNL